MSIPIPLDKTPEKKKFWGDDDDDDDADDDCNHSVTMPGIHSRSTFTVNSKGHTIETITTYHVSKVTRKVPLRVLSRMNLPRFGDAKLGEENVTLHSTDVVYFEHPTDQLYANDIPAKTLTKFIHDHSLVEHHTDSLSHTSHDTASPSLDDFTSPPPAVKSDKYIPPSIRFASAIDSSKNSETTLRVSNLTKSATEDDLRVLFESFGSIHRVSLPRSALKESRGFAYIQFNFREDAEKALASLQGHGYDHLIMQLDWAKSTKDIKDITKVYPPLPL